MDNIHFYKMNGLGNDFVIFDQRVKKRKFSKNDIINISNRHKGIGCDQVITINMLENTNDELIEFYNSNGEEVYACGNGSRCVANLLMNEKKINKIQIHTKEKSLVCKKLENDFISIDMGKPKLGWKEIPLSEDIKDNKINYKAHEIILENPFFVNVGNPHIVFFVKNKNDYNIDQFGPLIENDNLFPEKINVSIAEIISQNKISIDVWERGAGKTMACGTAACATAVAAVINQNCHNNLEIILPGGSLNINYELSKNIIMSGKTELTFEGSFEL